jgi:hypothetical protein
VATSSCSQIDIYITGARSEALEGLSEQNGHMTTLVDPVHLVGLTVLRVLVEFF